MIIMTEKKKSTNFNQMKSWTKTKSLKLEYYSMKVKKKEDDQNNEEKKKKKKINISLRSLNSFHSW
jgi:hypothetical protein